MIISHKYKYIFLKTNKTAGTSVEIALSRHCGPEDIITPLTPEDEMTRQQRGGLGPQNCWEDKYSGLLRIFGKKERRLRYYNHIAARRVKPRIGQKIWDEYYKFCFERNPWDRVISLYYWRHKTEPRPSLTEFLQSDVPQALKKKGSGVYTIDGELAVDKVCKYEQIAEELEAVRLKLGIPEPLELPHAKSQFRKDKRHYRDILDEEQKALVAEQFKFEIDLLGYEF